MLAMTDAEPRLMSGLQEAVLLLCKAGLKFESTLSIDGLLAVTLDNKEVFLVKIKETIKSSRDQNSVNDSRDGEDFPQQRNSSDGLDERHCDAEYLRVCEQPLEQASTVAESFSNDKSTEENVGTCADGPSTQNEGKIERNMLKRIKRPQNWPLVKRLREPPATASTGSQKSRTASEYFRKELERSTRDTQPLSESSRFSGFGISSRQSELQHELINEEVNNFLSKVKQEPTDESHFQYEAPLECQMPVVRNNVHLGNPVDYSHFPSHSHSTAPNHMLPPELWSQDSALSTVRQTVSSICSTMPTMTWSRRQFRPSNRSNCVNCGTNTTTVWRRSKEGQLLCNACGCYYKLHQTHRPASLMRGDIRRRSRRQQVIRWMTDTTSALPNEAVSFPLGWNPPDTEIS